MQVRTIAVIALAAVAVLVVCAMAPCKAHAAAYKVDMNSLSASQKTATVGDRVTYTVKVKGNPHSVNLVLHAYDGGEWHSYNGIPNLDVIRMKRVGSTDTYKGSFKVKQGLVPGDWFVSEVGISSGNPPWVDDASVDVPSKVAKKSIVKLVGVRTDTKDPVIKASGVSVSPKIIKPGSSVTLSIPVEDDLSGVNYVYFTYAPPAYKLKTYTWQKTIQGKINTSGTKAVAQFKLSGEDLKEIGKYELHDVQISDNVSNYLVYYDKRFKWDAWFEEDEGITVRYVDFSKADFTVANVYNVKFSPNGGGGSMSRQEVFVGKQVHLEELGFSRIGYVFTGWNTKKDGSGKAYPNRAAVKDIAKSGKTVTLYAQWRKAKTYTVRFKSNGGQGTVSSQKVQYNKFVKLHTNGFKKAGYAFAGWNTKKSGRGQQFKNKSSVFNLAKEGKTITLYAQWRPTKKLQSSALAMVCAGTL